MSLRKMMPVHFEPTFRRGTRENTFSPLSYDEHPATNPIASNVGCSRKATVPSSQEEPSPKAEEEGKSPHKSQLRHRFGVDYKPRHTFDPPPSSARSTTSTTGNSGGVSPSYRSSVGSVLTDSTNRAAQQQNRAHSACGKIDHNQESVRPTPEEELKPRRGIFQPHLDLSMAKPQPLGSHVRASSARGSSAQVACVMGTPRGEPSQSATRGQSTPQQQQVYQDPLMTIPSFNTAALYRGGKRTTADQQQHRPGSSTTSSSSGLFKGCAYSENGAVLHDVDSLAGRSAKKVSHHSESQEKRLVRIVSQHVAQRKGGLGGLWVAIARGAVGTVRGFDQQGDRADCGVTLIALQQQLSCVVGEDVQFAVLKAVLYGSVTHNTTQHHPQGYIVKFRTFADAFGEVPSY